MTDFINYVKASEFGNSNETDSLIRVDLDKTLSMVEQENSYYEAYLDKCVKNITRNLIYFKV